MASLSEQAPLLPGTISARFNAWLCGVLGYMVLAVCGACALSLLSWQIADPSLTHAASGPVSNLLGPVGAIISDLIMQLLGLAGVFVFLPPVFWALQLIGKGRLDNTRAKLCWRRSPFCCLPAPPHRCREWAAGRCPTTLAVYSAIVAQGGDEHPGDDPAGTCVGCRRPLLFRRRPDAAHDQPGLVATRSEADLSAAALEFAPCLPRLAEAGRNVGARDDDPARAHSGNAGAVLACGACLRRASTVFVPAPASTAGPCIQAGPESEPRTFDNEVDWRGLN